MSSITRAEYGALASRWWCRRGGDWPATLRDLDEALTEAGIQVGDDPQDVVSGPKVTRERYQAAGQELSRYLPFDAPTGRVLDLIVEALGVRVESPQTPEERIADFVAAVRRVSGPTDEAWARAVDRLIREHLDPNI